MTSLTVACSGSFGEYDGEYDVEYELDHGMLNGQVTITFLDGAKYVGEYKDNKAWNGTVYDKDGNVISTLSNGVVK